MKFKKLNNEVQEVTMEAQTTGKNQKANIFSIYPFNEAVKTQAQTTGKNQKANKFPVYPVNVHPCKNAAKKTGRIHKANVFSFSALAALCALLAISCKSTPTKQLDVLTEEVVVIGTPDETIVVEEAPAEEPAEEAVTFALLEETIKSADDSRKVIMDNQIEVPETDLKDADSALLSAKAVYDLGEDGASGDDIAAAYNNAALALNIYNDAISDYWQVKATDARARALSAQKEALNLKADVAVRDDFNLSTDIFNNGESNYLASLYEESIGFYIESETMYINLCAIAAEKRRLAAAALQAAEKKIEESERIAADADTVLANEGEEASE